MDDIVKAALAKWPNVPDCKGWLGLSARGDWYMRDDRVQAAGPFAQARGSRIQHDKLIGFIARNYEADILGRCFFQNGPQKVFVELEAAPWVWRLHTDGSVRSHTDRPAQVLSAWLDEQGRLFLHTDMGFGLVHSQDMLLAAEALERGDWPLHHGKAHEFPAQFGFVLSPAEQA
jgi:hypothetical protein